MSSSTSSSATGAGLSRHDIDSLRADLDRLVYKVLGSSDSTVRSAIEQCLHSGHERKRTVDRLADLLDSRRATKISDRLDDLLADLRTSSRSSRKRGHGADEPTSSGRGGGDSKKPRAPEEQAAPVPTEPVAKKSEASPEQNSNGNGNGNGQTSTEAVAVETVSAPLTTSQIQQMMANAQREIEERKRALAQRKAADLGGGLLPLPSNVLPIQPLSGGTQRPAASVPAPAEKPPASVEDAERAKKIADLQAQIRARLSGISAQVAGIGGGAGLPAVAPGATALANAPQEKPKPLILDEEGRTVDKTGRAISIPTLAPTLKANIRAKKKEIFNKASQPAAGERGGAALEDGDGSRFFDERLVTKPAVRNKRMLRFHEPGKFQQQAERMRMKTQLEKLQNEISQIARKTGISSATKLALIAPKQDSHADDVPQMEWWDSVILTEDLATVDGETGRVSIRESAITNLIEHPTQMKPPNEPLKPVYLPVFLTQKERKKLRRQNRREAWKEEQEKIRIGLAMPPEPKLRISNLMRVLGTEAVQDPTKIEAHVREQMAKRQKAHEDANNARKLTADQKREKKLRKVKEDTSCGVQVSVYRIRELHDIQAKKFKVETNAKQLLMTGVVTLFRDCCVVVVEGGPKQQKKYRRLMMQRIQWDEDMVKNADGKEVPNSCVLVWEGSSQRRHFGEVKFKPFPMEKMAREFFQKHQVEHYWDLAYSGAVLEASEDA